VGTPDVCRIHDGVVKCIKCEKSCKKCIWSGWDLAKSKSTCSKRKVGPKDAEEVEVVPHPVKRSRVEVVLLEHPKACQIVASLGGNRMEGSSKIDPTSLHCEDSPEVDTSSELCRYQRNIWIHLATMERLKDMIGEADAQQMAVS
jgi:hypothetical protein